MQPDRTSRELTIAGTEDDVLRDIQPTRSPIVLRSCLWKKASALPAEDLVVPNPDSGVLRELEEHYCARVLQRMAWLPHVLSGVPICRTQLDRIALLVEAIGKLSRERQRALLGSAILGVWLNHAFQYFETAKNSGSRGDDVHVDRLAWHLDALPVMLLPVIAEAKPMLPAIRYRLRRDARYGPVGVGWRLRTRGLAELEVEIRSASDGIAILIGDDRLASIPESELDSASAGADIDVAAPGLVVLESIQHATGTAMEIGSIGDFPELQAKMHGRDVSPVEPTYLQSVVPIERGLAVAAAHWPEMLREIQHFCRLVIPISLASQTDWLSSSDREFLYFVWLNVRRTRQPAEDVKCAELLLHESMHNKLWTLNLCVPLVANDGSELYRHPWREGLRSITTILHATYVFSAILGLYRRIVRADSVLARRLQLETFTERLHGEVALALDELERGAEFTEAGRSLMDAMVDAHCLFPKSRSQRSTH